MVECRVWDAEVQVRFLPPRFSGDIAQLVVALALQARCHRFESDYLHVQYNLMEIELDETTHFLAMLMAKEQGISLDDLISKLIGEALDSGKFDEGVDTNS